MISKPGSAIGIGLISITASLLFFSGCAAKLKSVSPDHIDLSGIWLIDKAASDEVVVMPRRSYGDADQTRDVAGRNSGDRKDDKSRAQGKPSAAGQRSNRSRPGFDQPAVMTATQMIIEQDRVSMGVAYPGEVYRDVDWGKTERSGMKVSSGWVNNNLVIRTDSEAMDFSETYSLQSSGQVLRVQLKLNGNQGETMFTRVFTRKASP